MNGLHDVGGMHGFGAIEIEANEPVFHQPWEGRVFAMALAMGGHFRLTLDRSRFLMESFPPYDRVALGYYERWANRLFMVSEMRGFLDADEVAACKAGEVPDAGPVRAKAVKREDLVGLFNTIRSSCRPIAAPAAFAVGDAVRARVMNPKGHTRLPRYARGKRGVVIADHGGHVFADTNAMDPPREDPCRLYTVKFAATELWGHDVNRRDSVCLEMWEHYLERP
jgi:nitrile hydratase